MLLEHERYYGLGVDALVTVCSWNTNVIMVRMLLEHERCYGLGMDALVTGCSGPEMDRKCTQPAALHVVGGLSGKPVCTLFCGLLNGGASSRCVNGVGMPPHRHGFLAARKLFQPSSCLCRHFSCPEAAPMLQPMR